MPEKQQEKNERMVPDTFSLHFPGADIFPGFNEKTLAVNRNWQLAFGKKSDIMSGK